VDIEWAIKEIDRFLGLTELYRQPDPPGILTLTPHMSNRGNQDDIRASAQVVEQIFHRVMPDWRTSVPNDRNESVNRWCQHMEAATRVKVQLQRQEELAEKLGDNAPRLSAGHLHPWVWDSGKTMWSSGHYREAVSAAARALNAFTQTKVDRRDVSETNLFKQVFTLDAPQAGRPRLRLMADDGSETYKNLHRGAMCYAEGLYAAIRNPANHAVLSELPADEALERLAAFSVLARWVDQATLDKAP
jgi:Protein of unknown function (Hypoth_ymh)